MTLHRLLFGLLLALIVSSSAASPTAWGARAVPADPSVAPARKALAQATPSLGKCLVTGVQTADPARIELGQAVTLKVAISGACPVEVPGRADIMLVLDHSGSMNQGGKAQAARDAIKQFAEHVDFARHRIGIVPFNETAYVAQPLTTRLDRVLSTLDDIGVPIGGTYVAQAIDAADRELAISGRPDAAAIVVLLTDGLDDESAMLAAARKAKRDGLILMTIALGDDAATEALRKVASAEEYFYVAPGPDDLAAIYQQIATIILTFAVTDVRVTDRLADDTSYVPGTGDPDEPAGTTELQWRRSSIAERPSTIRYSVRPGHAGRLQPSAAVSLDYVDGDLSRQRLSIAPATIDVLAPVIRSVYVPIGYRDQCVLALRRADVALTIDNSDSMKGAKLAQAVAAARAFVSILNLPGDQAAIVTYDQQARLVQPLTGDRAALDAALGALVSGSGTRIDRGLEAALAALSAEGHRAENRPVIVLLSDGIQIEERQRPLELTSLARGRGVAVFTIALGADADRPMLQLLAGDPSHMFVAPEASDLESIYRRIAGEVVCR